MDGGHELASCDSFNTPTVQYARYISLFRQSGPGTRTPVLRVGWLFAHMILLGRNHVHYDVRDFEVLYVAVVCDESVGF